MRLVRQAIQTPDGTILESRHRHDFVTHKDAVSGETYMVDGGLEYSRGIVNKVPAKDLCVYLEDGIGIVREAITWGTRGKSGGEPLRYVKLCEMSDAHIQACLETQTQMHPHYREAFQQELQYRKDYGIAIEDI